MSVYCRICGTAGAACGDSHKNPDLPLLTAAAFKGDPPMATEPQELAEYHYWTGHIETTAMLTPKMAERLGAVPIDEDLPDADPTANNEANRAATVMKDGGVTGDGTETITKARTARNKRSAGA